MTQTKHLTLHQLAVLRGFRTQKAVLDHLRARGFTCPQPELSGMFNGKTSYPKARAGVADALDLTDAALIEHIKNAGRC